MWRGCGLSSGTSRSGVTFGVVQDSLHQHRVLGEALRHQQDALLNTMATQQGAAAGTLSMMGKEEGRVRRPGPASRFRRTAEVPLLVLVQVLTLMNCCSRRSRPRTSL